MIMLNAKNIKTNRPSKSLNHKNINPFRITKTINNMTYELKLSKGMNIFFIFHSWLLHLDNNDSLLNQIKPPPFFTNIDEKKINHFVNKIINFQINKRRKDSITREKDYLIYKFKWIEHIDDFKWYSYTYAVGYPNLIADFHHFNSNKSKSHSSFQTSKGWEPLIVMLMNNPHMLVQEN